MTTRRLTLIATSFLLTVSLAISAPQASSMAGGWHLLLAAFTSAALLIEQLSTLREP